VSPDEASTSLPVRPVPAIPAPRPREAAPEADQHAPEVSGSPTAPRRPRSPESGSEPATGPIDLPRGLPAPLFDPAHRDVEDRPEPEVIRRPRLQRLIEVVLGMPAGTATPVGLARKVDELDAVYAESLRVRDLTIGQHRQFLRERGLVGDFWTWMTERSIVEDAKRRRRLGDLTLTDLVAPVPVVSEGDGDE
jgi:hypothetical protein